MMVSGPHLGDAEEEYTDSELIEEEEYSDEAGDEFGNNEIYVPRTFEDFQTLFKNQFDPTPDDELSEEPVSSPSDELHSGDEPQSVDLEMEKRVEEAFKVPEKIAAPESPEPETSPDEGPFSQEDEYDPEEPEDLSGLLKFLEYFWKVWDNFPSDEELIDEEEIDYDDEEELGSDEEEVSDIDDTDLMKRLEAKYGKISGENSEDEDDPDASWTSNYGKKLLTILF